MEEIIQDKPNDLNKKKNDLPIKPIKTKGNKFRNQLIIMGLIWLYLIILLVRNERRQTYKSPAPVTPTPKVAQNKEVKIEKEKVQEKKEKPKEEVTTSKPKENTQKEEQKINKDSEEKKNTPPPQEKNQDLNTKEKVQNNTDNSKQNSNNTQEQNKGDDKNNL